MPSRRVFFGRTVAANSTTSPTPAAPAASLKTDGAPSVKPAYPDRRPSAITMDLLFNKDKRKSLSGQSPSRKGSVQIPKPARLEIVLQSPPLVFFGGQTQSTGALMGGVLNLVVTDPTVKLKTLTMRLLAKVTTHYPVHLGCPNCTTQTTELFKWNFITESKTYEKETHALPFSYLLPGHLTASMNNKVGTIEYSLLAEATPADCEPITETRKLEIKRALPAPESDRISTRIFPPTNLKAELTHPLVMHPIGGITCQFRLTGVMHSDKGAHFRWRLRRLSWRLEEHSKIVSPACDKHADKVGGKGKGKQHEDKRDIGQDELKAGWKSDYSDGGVIELEFNVGAEIPHHASNTRQPTCDLENPTGIAVVHKLCLEMVVAEEMATIRHPNTWNQTGTARVLRTVHTIILSEREGMGISWDEEQPPMYEDVPDSPPGYARMDDYVGEEIPANDLDLEPLSAPPAFTE